MNRKMETLFVSDLHLDVSRPNITSLFLDFLRQSATQAEALYILGDLFEVWIGDDNSSELNQAITTGLHQLVKKGTPIHLMHGNRDFLIGQAFASASGCSLLPDTTVIDLYGTSTLLLHGDTLCTDDKDYMEFRTMVRNPEWQEDFVSKPLQERMEIANGLRDKSKASIQDKSEEIMDVNQQAVEQILIKHSTQQLIHGHTHRPDTHHFLLDGKPAKRIVLGDWYQHGSVLRCTLEGCKLEKINNPAAS